VYAAVQPNKPKGSQLSRRLNRIFHSRCSFKQTLSPQNRPTGVVENVTVVRCCRVRLQGADRVVEVVFDIAGLWMRVRVEVASPRSRPAECRYHIHLADGSRRRDHTVTMTAVPDTGTTMVLAACSKDPLAGSPSRQPTRHATSAKFSGVGRHKKEGTSQHFEVLTEASLVRFIGTSPENFADKATTCRLNHMSSVTQKSPLERASVMEHRDRGNPLCFRS